MCCHAACELQPADDSGRWEIYVDTFPERSERQQISENGGRQPRWNPRGGELFFVEEDDLMAVSITTEPTFEHGVPERLFSGADVGTHLRPPMNRWSRYYDVAPDGQRFVVVQGVLAGRNDVVLVRNWAAELELPKPPG